MGKRILIVDDDLVIRVMARDMLEKGGHTVAGEAGTGDEAVDLFKTLRPDLVIMDIVMPVKNGLEAAKEILAMDAKAKIIISSALDNIPLIKASFTIGAVDFLAKPFSTEKLMESIRKA